jgi:hypothetical protein
MPIYSTILYQTHQRHIPTRVFKQAVRLTRQAEKITKTLGSINPLNAGHKKNEVLAMLHKFFPSMENFAANLKKYKRAFEDWKALQEQDKVA